MRIWIVVTLLLCGMAGAKANEHCRVLDEEEHSLLGRLYDLRMQPECADELARAIREARTELGRPLDVAGLDEEAADDARSERHALESLVGLWTLRQALRTGDIAAARQQIAALQTLQDTSAGEAALEYPLDLARILAVLDGHAAPPDPRQGPPAKPDWMLQFGFCGTATVAYRDAATSLPTAADAWMALGRPDLALVEVLGREWITAVSLGTTPPRLREYVEAMLGPGSWEREVRTALNSIRIRQEIDGWHVTLPLLGQTLPLPMGYQSWAQTDPVMFSQPSDAARYIGTALLGHMPE